jgi:hypothetical protein
LRPESCPKAYDNETFGVQTGLLRVSRWHKLEDAIKETVRIGDFCYIKWDAAHRQMT